MSGWRLPLLTWRRLPGSGWGQLRAASVSAALAMLVVALPAGATPRTYRVAPGDSLSRIAQRHGTTVAALCRANGLEREQILRVGQRLRLPEPPAGAAPAKESARGTTAPARAKSAAPKAHRDESEAGGGSASKPATPSLSKTQAAPPTPTPRSPRASEPSWAPYVRAPERRGYLRLESTVGRWSGQALQGQWEIPESARAGITRVLASWRTGGQERIHGRLIRMLVKVSDTFGGRPIRVVCGYRDPAHQQHTKHSKHHLGRAIDFSIPGVPNEVVRDFLRHTFDSVGVGYYPNSTHVHLDMREHSTYWVDVSRPGEPPRYVSPSAASRPSTRADQNAPARRPAAPERRRSKPQRTMAAPLASSPAEESTASAPSEPSERPESESPSDALPLELPVVGGEN